MWEARTSLGELSRESQLTRPTEPKSRTPPVPVRRELAQEVGFGCPVEGCGSPYLTWHHFDPPWSERQHHEAAGMVALCRAHHDAADAGAYTKRDFYEMKAHGRDRTQALTGDFQW